MNHLSFWRGDPSLAFQCYSSQRPISLWRDTKHRACSLLRISVLLKFLRHRAGFTPQQTYAIPTPSSVSNNEAVVITLKLVILVRFS